MENIETIDVINYITSNINIMYIITCNALSYCVINLLETFNKENKIRKIYKRLISLFIAISIGALEVFILDHEIDPIFYGVFIQFLTWDYMFKPIVNKIIEKCGSDKSLNEDVFS